MAPTDTARPAHGLLEQIRTNQSAPLLFHNASLVTLDPTIGTLTGDLLVGGSVIVGVGPGIVTAAGDDGALVVDVTDCTVVPLLVDVLSVFMTPRARTTSLRPGNAADFAVVPGNLTVAEAVDVIERSPQSVFAIVVGGEVVVWDGKVVDPDEQEDLVPQVGGPLPEGDPRQGVWVDHTGFLEQELRADGRYDETRGGRPHAFEGRFSINGDRVDYLDDLGFWAYGEFIGQELHHAGYVMTLRA